MPRHERAVLTATGWDTPLAHELLDEALPEPGPGEVRLDVEACGVCHRDLIDRSGRFPFQRVPIVPGHEAVGRVSALGAGATTFRVGDRVATMHRDACGVCTSCQRGETSLCEGAAHVFGILADGGYASVLIAPESALYPAPADLPAPEAAVLHCTFGTAYRDLVTLGHLRAGERVLVTGANGGVGSAGVQIAARLGAEVVAVVRDARHGDWLRSLGAHEVVVDAAGDFGRGALGGSIDLALEAVGEPTFASTLRSLRVGGRLTVVGNVTPARVSLNLGFLITRGLTVTGGSGATRRDMREVVALHRTRAFSVPIDRVWPLARADEAQRATRAGGLAGRVVLVAG